MIVESDMKIVWVNTSGGPLICATLTALSRWRGAVGGCADGGRTDYERACDQPDYLSTISCGTDQVLVLGDEPLQSAFARTGDGLVIVRWVSCVSADRAEQVIELLPSVLPEQEAAQLVQLNDSRLCLVDAALDGAHAMTKASCIDIEPGYYEVTTERHVSKQEFDFLVHRFRLQLADNF